MASRDNSEEGSISRLFESLGFRQSEDNVSPEDIAWADSCLIKDPEYLDSNWSHLRDALMEILDDEPHSLVSSTATTVDFVGGSDMERLASNDEVEAAWIPEQTNDNHSTFEESESENDDSPINRKIIAGLLKGSKRNPLKTSLQDDILSNGDYQRVLEANDSADITNIPAELMEPSIADIFRVWDLGIPAEEDEFGEQVFQFMPLSSDNILSSKDGSLDDLIAAVGDLSLNKTWMELFGM